MPDKMDYDLKIKKLNSSDKIPFDLLLLADETIEAIEKYIYTSDVYVVSNEMQEYPVAIFVLQKVTYETLELKNIAVAETQQNRGLGSYIINQIKLIAKAENINTIIVGTPDSESKEIRFYEKNGFKKYDIRKDFFIVNYSKPIIENGTMLRDMVMLKLDL
jgi:ribosomal protein S18 acetylase RimI-like enzyme